MPSINFDDLIPAKGTGTRSTMNFDDLIPARADEQRDGFLGRADAVMRGAADTLSFGLADEIAAQAQSGPLTLQDKPDEYYRSGIFSGAWNPLGAIAKKLDAPWASPTKSEDYDRALSQQRAIDETDGRNRTAERIAGQILGVVGGGVGLAKNGLSMTANAINAGKGLANVSKASAVEGMLLSGAQGFGSGEGVEDRLKGTATGMGLGLVTGAALPSVVAVAGGALKGAARPFLAPLRPDRYADEALLTYMRRSGLGPEEIADQLRRAVADGQGVFAVADAMGMAGQRALTPVARTPNNVRQEVFDFLTGRQMDQGRRIASSLEDASGSPLTANQMQTLLRQERAAEADRLYAPVRADTSAIDVSPAVDVANKAISPTAEVLANAKGAVPTDLAVRSGVEAGEASIRDPIRQAMKEARSYLASDTLTVTNVDKAFRAKTNIDQMIASAAEQGRGGVVDALTPMRNALDDALANTSKEYAAARDAYRVASGRIDAVDVGREMARPRRRADDNLSMFGTLPGDQLQPARTGYFDPLIARAESSAGSMTNAARPFLSESSRRELPAFAAPGRGDQLQRRLAREQRMFETAQATLGGSKTADNAADIIDAADFDPAMLANLALGGWKQALITGARQSMGTIKGTPPSVLERTGRVLTETKPERALQFLQKAQGRRSANDKARALIIDILLNGQSTAEGRLPAIP